MHVSAVRPLRYRLRVQIYEFLLIRPPASAVFFRVPLSFSSLRHHTPRKPANFQPKPVYFRPEPHCFSSSLAHPSQPPAARKAQTALSPLAPHARVPRTQPFFVFCLHTFTHPNNPLMHNELGVKVSPHFFLHPPHRSPPRNDRGQKWPKAVKTGAQGEAFTRNTLYFKRLCVNLREHTRGEAFTRNPLMINTLQAKGEEVKAKNRKTPDARVTRTRWAVAARRPVPLVGRGRKNAPRRAALPRKNCNFAGCAPPLFTRKCTPSENAPV